MNDRAAQGKCTQQGAHQQRAALCLSALQQVFPDKSARININDANRSAQLGRTGLPDTLGFTGRCLEVIERPGGLVTLVHPEGPGAGDPRVLETWESMEVLDGLECLDGLEDLSGLEVLEALVLKVLEVLEVLQAVRAHLPRAVAPFPQAAQPCPMESRRGRPWPRPRRGGGGGGGAAGGAARWGEVGRGPRGFDDGGQGERRDSGEWRYWSAARWFCNVRRENGQSVVPTPVARVLLRILLRTGRSSGKTG